MKIQPVRSAPERPLRAFLGLVFAIVLGVFFGLALFMAFFALAMRRALHG